MPKKKAENGENQVQTAPKEKKKINWKLILLITAGTLLLLGAIIYAAYHMILDHYLGKINIVTGEDDLIFVTTPITYEEEIPLTGEETVTETEELPLPPEHNGEIGANNLPLICNTKDVTNILLMATDARGNEAGRSDTMILLSINEKTNRIVLCSFLRDLYALYPQEPQSPVSGRYDKLNHAHAYGGPELTMAVFKEAFNIEVSYYVKVNFNSFVTIVDAMGGLDMHLTAEEAWYINSKSASDEMMLLFPNHSREPLPSVEGTYRLNGLQSLCHARNRYIGSDWARTQRQRNLISQMVVQARGLSLTEIDSFLNQTLPLVTTNIPKDQLKKFVGNALSYIKYEIESTRLPLNGTYQSINYNLVPDLEVNCNDLYEKIYSEKPRKEEEKS